MSLDLETTRLLKRGIPLYTTLAAALLVLALAAILSLARDVFVPVALSILLSFILAPAVRFLQRLYVPRGLAVMLTVIAAFGMIISLVVVMGTQLSALGQDLPKYQTTIRQKIEDLSQAGGAGGTFGRVVEALSKIGEEFSAGKDDAADAEVRRPAQVVVVDDEGTLGKLGVFVSPLLHPLGTAFLVLIFVIFILAAREDLRNRFIRLLGPDDIQNTTKVLDDAGLRLSKLFLAQLAVNTVFGVVVAIALWLIGIPSAILWGIVAGVFRFVPYVGAVVGAIAPLALAFAVDPDWTMLIATALLFIFLEPIVGHIIEPMVFGHSTGLSPLAVILAAAIWTFLWGPIGLVLATPLTVCLVVLGRHVPRLTFLDIMLGDSPALSPAEIFYQRMLAGDPMEAVAQARDFLRERSLATYYDEIALEALRLAHEDIERGRLTPERQAKLRATTSALISNLGRIVSDPRPRGGTVGSEAAAAVLAAGPDLGASTRVVAPSDLKPHWRSAVPILCVAQPESLDEIVAAMLAQVLQKHGLRAEVLSVDRRSTQACDPSQIPAGVNLVCLSYMEPLSTLHLRHAVATVRRYARGSSVIVGIWRGRDRRIARELGKASRANAVAPTIGTILSSAVEAATS